MTSRRRVAASLSVLMMQRLREPPVERDVAVQFGGSVDVRLASHVTTFGHFRAGIPTEDPGSGHYAVPAGFRFVIR